MLKILTRKEFLGLNPGADYMDFPVATGCFLGDASKLFSISMSDITGNDSLGYIELPFEFFPVLNRIRVFTDITPPELLPILSEVILEISESKILENIEIAKKAVYDKLPGNLDDVDVTEDTFNKSKSYTISNTISYYQLEKTTGKDRIDIPEATLNAKWNGRNLYIWIRDTSDKNQYSVSLSEDLEDYKLIIQLIKYKYVLRQFDTKTISY